MLLLIPVHIRIPHQIPLCLVVHLSLPCWIVLESFLLFILTFRVIVIKVDILETEFRSLDILAFTETWLNSEIDNSDILIDSFNPLHQNDRQNRDGGGVAVYVNNNIASKRRPDLETNEVECVWLELIRKKWKTLLGVFYRPPNSCSNIWDKYITQLIYLWQIYHSVDLPVTNISLSWSTCKLYYWLFNIWDWWI